MTTVPKPSGKAIPSEQKRLGDEASGIDTAHQVTPEEESAITSHHPDKASGLIEPEPDDPIVPI